MDITVSEYQSIPVDDPDPFGVTRNGTPKGFITLAMTTGSILNMLKIPMDVEIIGIYFFGASQRMQSAKTSSMGTW